MMGRNGSSVLSFCTGSDPLRDVVEHFCCYNRCSSKNIRSLKTDTFIKLGASNDPCFVTVGFRSLFVGKYRALSYPFFDSKATLTGS